jgi:DNA (cytosine-5)-methyltransferase 1
LFFEFARVAELVRPRWVLVENVPGLLSSNGGRDFGTVLGTLADLGYGLAWRILDSRFFGVPQRRRRVFIVGARADGDPRAAAERAGQVLAVGTRCPRHPATRGEAGEDVAVASLSGLGSGGPDDNDGQGGRLVSYALNAKRGNRDDGESETFVAAPLSHGSNPNSNAAGRRREDDENLVSFFTTQPDDQAGGRGAIKVTEITTAPALDTITDARKSERSVRVVSGASVRRLTPTECERLQGFPDGWTQLGGTPDSKRYAALGDAVTVPVAHWIGARLAAAGEASP